MYRTCINSWRLLSWFSGFSRLVIWQQSHGCSTDAVEKRPDLQRLQKGHLLTCLHTTQPAGVPTMNSSKPSLMPKKIPSKNVRDPNLLFAPKSPCCRHGSWMRRTLKCTLECSEPVCTLHSTGNDLTSKSTHQANATCSDP